jgi:hypothetical protein
VRRENSLMRHGTGQTLVIPPLQPHFPAVVRLSVGMTGLNIVNIHEIIVDIK